MKNRITKLMLLPFLLIITNSLFAGNIVLVNETDYPTKDKTSKVAVQWANNGNEIETENIALSYGDELTPQSIQPIAKKGKVNLVFPENAQYFRVIVWSNEETKNPDLVTDWLMITPNQSYTLMPEHLIPSALMAGTGC